VIIPRLAAANGHLAIATLEISDVVSAEDVAHAEIMFKIDFHEYYALLERGILQLKMGASIAAWRQFS
jgi:hypothetical protein